MRRFLGHSAAAAFLIGVAAIAQVQNGRIEGNVLDTSGAAIPGAKLSATNTRTQVKQDAETDSDGYYIFPQLQTGMYTLTAEAQGFRKSNVTNIELNLGVTLRQDIKLELGSLSESVQVEASAVRVQTSEATIQRAVTMRDIDTLPQLSRSPIGLATYLPGVQINPGDTTFSRINGLRQGSNNNTLDGIDVNDSVLPRLGLALNANNMDSVEEIRVITNGAKAEYGRNGGGQVELITRSGTNQLHGNLFEYHRNTVLNANNFFNKSNGTELPRPKFIQNQYGGSLGGPVVIPKLFNGRDKLFFFFNFQGSRTAQGVVRNRTVYSPEVKQGLFRWRLNNGPVQSYNIVANDPRRKGIDPISARSIAAMPNPNNNDVGDGLNLGGYRFNAPANNQGDQLTAKGDWNLRPTHRIWVRYSRFRTLTPADTLNNAESTFPGQPNGSQGGLRYGWAAGSSWTIKPWLVNELIVGHSQSSVEFARVWSLAAGEPRIDFGQVTDVFPVTFGSARNSPVNQITDNLSLLRGRHSFKTGLRFSLTTQYQTSDASIWPTIFVSQANGNAVPGTIGPAAGTIATADRGRFDGIYNELLGRVSSISTTFYSDLEAFQKTGTPRVRNFKFRDYGYYFQDDWRVRSNLTLNLGMRWEFYGVPFERDGFQGVVEQARAGLVHAAGNIANLTVKRSPDYYKNDWNNFAPRFGFAWDPFDSGKTSIRGSFGMFYDRVIGATATDVDGSTPGFAQSVQVLPNQAPGSDNRASDALAFPTPPDKPTLTPTPNRGISTLTQFDPNFRTPYVLQTNLTIQREVLHNTVLEAGYVGNRGIKQLMDVNWNQTRIYSSGFLGAFQELNQMRANTPASNAIVRMFGGNATTAVSAIGANVLNQGQVGTAAATIDTSNYTRYATGGVGDFYLRNFPQFQTLVMATNAGRTYYDSLQMSLRRQQGAVRFALNYTWSKTIDNASVDGSGFTSPVDSFNLALNRARSDIDRPHTFNWMASYFLPFGRGKALAGNMPEWLDRIAGGWELGTLGFWISGTTMTVSSGLATGPTGNSTWANFDGDRNLGSVQRVGNGVRYFSVEEAAKFSAPAAGFIGSSGRNSFRGPTFFNTDVSMVKRFRFAEKKAATFRAEGYNIFNNVNFSTPGLSVQTPQSLGVISSTVGNPRIFQLALRVDF